MFAAPSSMRRALATAAALASVVSVTCGQPRHFPIEQGTDFSEVKSDAATADGSAILGDDSNSQVPTCSLGPEGGVCDCVDQPLLGTPPTLYFILDRSGSMSEENKWTAIRQALLQVVTSLGPRADFAAAVFPSPRSSDECAPGLEVFAPARGDSPAGLTGPIETNFFSSFSSIPAAGGTPTAATLKALFPRITSLGGAVYVILATDGGPNCNAAAECGAGTCTINIEETYAGCTVDGPTNCCADAGPGSPYDCLDSNPTYEAVKDFADAGVPVFIMGIPGSAPYASLLDQLAQAGGTARASEPLYYAVGSADQQALEDALSAIAATVTGTCTLALNAAPNPTLVNVFLDEQPLAQSGPDGWTLDGAVITILGASCQKILAGSILDVRVVVGCPTYIR